MSTEQPNTMTEERALEVIEKAREEVYLSNGGYRYLKHDVFVHIANEFNPVYKTVVAESFEQAVYNAGYNYVPVDMDEYNEWWEAEQVRAEMVVQCGIQYLDENYPDWHDKVHAASLNMASGQSCVLGQVFGNYQDGMNTIFSEKYAGEQDMSTWATQHGFVEDGACYSALDTIWQRALKGEL